MGNYERTDDKLIFRVPYHMEPDLLLQKLFEMTETEVADVTFISEFESDLSSGEVKEAVKKEVDEIKLNAKAMKEMIIKPSKTHFEFSTDKFRWLVKECKEMFVSPVEGVPRMTFKVVCDEFTYEETEGRITVTGADELLDNILKVEEEEAR